MHIFNIEFIIHYKLIKSISHEEEIHYTDMGIFSNTLSGIGTQLHINVLYSWAFLCVTQHSTSPVWWYDKMAEFDSKIRG
jgi:hypothetical protein